METDGAQAHLPVHSTEEHCLTPQNVLLRVNTASYCPCTTTTLT